MHAIHPENEKLPLVVQSLFLSIDIEGMGMGDVHKNFGKNILALGVRLARCCAGSVHSYIGGYVLKYVVKYIVIPCYL